MSNWTDPTGDDYEKYTGDERPAAPQDGPPEQAGGEQRPPAPASPEPGIPQGGAPVPPPAGYGVAPQYGAPYAAPVTTPTSTIVLLIVSILFTLGACGLGIPSLVLAIIAMTKRSQDLAATKRLTRIGWIVFAVLAVISLIALVALVALGVMSGTGSSTVTY